MQLESPAQSALHSAFEVFPLDLQPKLTSVKLSDAGWHLDILQEYSRKLLKEVTSDLYAIRCQPHRYTARACRQCDQLARRCGRSEAAHGSEY